MKKIIFISFLIVSQIILNGCKKGCRDNEATNYESTADKDCKNCCKYSEVVFYGSQLSPYPPVVVQVNGSTIGTIQAAYPSGPGNCSVPGVAKYQFEDSKSLDWVATDNAGFIFSGTIKPNSQVCMKVRVF